MVSQKRLARELLEGVFNEMNKKTYITPTVEITEIETVAMLAASISIDKNGEGDEQLSNDRRGTWGNLWD